ncbi:uncharacterized protein LOC109536989 isoform X1 [Dendroctonus ponderosae]|uniref:uncharacterized protein LOC109536989 isoform X1 n=1 Tax=Dendroctonus ponderosae TaxID=77166 RepID=UPI002034D1EE|nr:uncharacterized protein LOC109536989 isoform X1 [Dendroctonus ponderosae]
MSKKQNKAHRDKHSRSHRKHKREPEKLLEEIGAKKLKIDKNACGDCPGPQIPPDAAQQAKRSKEQAPRGDKSEKAPNSATDKAVRHHSLEKPERSFLDKTRLLFRKEKSFNDALQKASDLKHEKPETKRRHHKHRSRKAKETVEDQPVKKREKSHKSKPKSQEKTPKASQGFGTIQEVIFCQMNQPPYKMKNDKTASEVKDLYRRIRNEHKHKESSNQEKPTEAAKLINSQGDRKSRHHHGESSKKPPKPCETPASEQYITQTRYPDFNCKVKHHSKRREHSHHKISLGPYEKYFALDRPEKHHHEHREKIHRRHSPEKVELRNETTQAEEQKIHQIIEGDLKNYFGKIQTLIDRKLDALMQINKCGRRKGDKARSKSKPKEPPVEPAKPVEEKLNKEELINEVIKRLKQEEQATLNANTLSGKETMRKDASKTCEGPVRLPYTHTSKKENLFLQEHPRFFRHMFSASEETVRPKRGKEERRSSSPARFPLVAKPQHCSSQSPEPFLQEIFPPPESFQCRQKHEFIVEGIEPPTLECPRRKPGRVIPVRILDCKTVSIVNIKPREETRGVIQTQTSGKSHKSSKTERDLVEKKKNSKSFKLYYKYSRSDQEDDCSDRESVVSDSGRLVSDPSEEKVVVVPLVTKKWNRAVTPRNSHLNNIMEEPSDLSSYSPPNRDFFVPLSCTKQYYCRVLTSSHSDYCLKVDKKSAQSDLSVQSREADDGRFMYYENGKCRYHKIEKSKSDFKLYPDTHHKQQLLSSKSDVILDENRAREVLKTLFLEERSSRKQKPRNYSAFKSVLNEELSARCCKECQTETSKSAEETKQKSQKRFQEIYQTIDCLEESISSRPAPPATVDVAASALRFTQPHAAKEPRLSSKSTNRKMSQKSVGVGVGELGANEKKVLDVAVGDSKGKLRAKTPVRKQPVKEPKQYKSTGVSPIRLTGEAVVQVSPPRPQRKPWTPRVRKPKPPSEQSATPKVRQQTQTTKSGAEACVKVFRSLEKNGKPSSALRDDFHSQRVESCFHRYEAESRRIPSSAPLTSNVGPAIVSTAAYSCQMDTSQVESSTSSSVSDASKPVRKSKSLVEVKNQSQSEMCCPQAVEKEQSFLSEDLEKFRNKPRLRCASKSHGSSLEQYIGDKFTSRLLLTKDYKRGQISSYQKRKLYDLERRQKMKRNYRFSKEMVQPQIFEVRFLSMMNRQSSESTERAHGRLKEKGHGEAKDSPDEGDIESAAAESSEQGQVADGVESAGCSSDSTCQLKLLCQQLLANETLMKSCPCSAPGNQQCPACKNVWTVMDQLQATLAKYRRAEDPAENPQYPSEEAIEQPAPEVEDIFSAPFNQTSSDSNNVELVSVETVEEFRLPILSQPISCPILTTNSPSFEFLYEERDQLEPASQFSNLVQTFNLNLKTPLFQAIKHTQSPAGSIESGYASVKSRSGHSSSLTHFFKKPNIAALFRAPSRRALQLEKVASEPDVEDNVYEEMTKSCQLYARKVKASGEVRLEDNLEEYQEFSLQLLLGGNGSIVLESRALSLRSGSSDMGIREDADELEEDECALDSQDDVAAEHFGQLSDTMIPSVAELTNSPISYQIVLSNRILNTEISTYLGPELMKSSRTSISIQEESSCTWNPSNEAPQEFVAELIKIYEKELTICAKIYEDVAFARSLLDVVEEPKNSGKKLAGFCRFFTRKPAGKVEKSQLKQQIYSEGPARKRLEMLASSARKCFSMLADAVIANTNIQNELKICGLLKLLERLENGHFHLIQNETQVDLEEEFRGQIKQAFRRVHEICAREAKKCKRRISEQEMQLIRAWVIKFRLGLLVETELVATYIGQGLIQTEEELEASVRFLLRSQEVNVARFAECCCKFRR